MIISPSSSIKGGQKRAKGIPWGQQKVNHVVPPGNSMQQHQARLLPMLREFPKHHRVEDEEEKEKESKKTSEFITVKPRISGQKNS